jgi:hypothetical protein
MKKMVDESYENYKNTVRQTELDKAFELYKDIQGKAKKELLALNDEDVKVWGEHLEKMKEMFPRLSDIASEQLEELTTEEINQFLDDINIGRSEEFDRPWKTDSTKSNKAFNLYLKEDPDRKFEIVKDIEDGYWSIHFKTTKEGDTEVSPLTLKQK